MGKSGEGRGLFRRRSTPAEQDPTIDIANVLSAYGRTAVPASAAPAGEAMPTAGAVAVATIDDDSVRYAPDTGREETPAVVEASALTELHEFPEIQQLEQLPEPDAAPDDLVVDLTDAAPGPEAEPVAGITDEPGAPVEVVETVDLAETVEDDAQHEEPLAHDEHHEHGEAATAELVETVDVVEAIEDDAQHEEPLAHDEHHEHGEAATAAAMAAMAEVVDTVETPEPAAADTASVWWQTVPTHDLGGMPAAGPEQHDEQHAHHHDGEAAAAAAVVDLAHPFGEHETDDVALDVPADDATLSGAEPVSEAVGGEVPPPAGWWEDASSGWGPADVEQIDAVVHDSLPTAEADHAPEPLSPDEVYGHHHEPVADDEPEHAGWAVAEAVVDEPVAAEATPWWQSLQTDDLGGVPVAGPEQHDEQHSHHQDEAVALADRLAPLETPADEHTPWWRALQDPAHDVRDEPDVVDLRDEELPDHPEAVAARLARLRDAGLLSPEEYAAETAGLFADRG